MFNRTINIIDSTEIAQKAGQPELLQISRRDLRAFTRDHPGHWLSLGDIKKGQLSVSHPEAMARLRQLPQVNSAAKSVKHSSGSAIVNANSVKHTGESSLREFPDETTRYKKLGEHNIDSAIKQPIRRVRYMATKAEVKASYKGTATTLEELFADYYTMSAKAPLLSKRGARILNGVLATTLAGAVVAGIGNASYEPSAFTLKEQSVGENTYLYVGKTALMGLGHATIELGKMFYSGTEHFVQSEVNKLSSDMTNIRK